MALNNAGSTSYALNCLTSGLNYVAMPAVSSAGDESALSEAVAAIL